jgi:hypothetical protein
MIYHSLPEPANAFYTKKQIKTNIKHQAAWTKNKFCIISKESQSKFTKIYKDDENF